ncbi:MAG: trypsin-like peptidase domain-containing protein [Saprospiraceae bacterium]|nr:trypsin-like peptidase domain-containing protein [Saprospiraceae bacterium]
MNFFYTLKDAKGNTSFLGQNKERVNDERDLYKITPFELFGTGFLVSDAGHVVTNRHVAEPWLESDLKETLFIHDGSNYIKLIYGGKSIKLGIIANQQTINKNELASSIIPCNVSSVRSSNDPTVDLSIIQLSAKVVPPGSSYVSKEDIISRDSFNKVTVLDDVVVQGYPFGIGLWDNTKPYIQTTLDKGSISMIRKPHEIQYNANSAKGASGSPVIHVKTGKIIGVNTYGTGADHNVGILAYLIGDLMVQ